MQDWITYETNRSVVDHGTLEQMLSRGARLQYQAVEFRAYENFLRRGGAHGSDLQDWFDAERELLGPS